MFKYILSLLLSLALCSIGSLEAAPAQMTKAQNQAFQYQLDAALKDAENTVQQSLEDMQGQVLNQGLYLRYQIALDTLEVKQVLAEKFRRSQKMGDPILREAVINLMNQSSIDMGDLKDLQDLIDRRSSSVPVEEPQPEPGA